MPLKMKDIVEISVRQLEGHPSADFALTSASVASGGTAGQVYAKIDSTNFNAHWVDPSGGTSDSAWGAM